MILTYRFRIKDGSAKRHLRRYARAVNAVWNYCGDVNNASRRLNKRWPSAFDLVNLTSGSSALLGINSGTIGATCLQFAISRNAARRRPAWRGRRSLGWVPLSRAAAFRLEGATITYRKRRFHFWKSREIEGTVKTGSLCEDARGRWYLNLQCEVAEDRTCGAGSVGVDLGLKSLAALSDGTTIENPRHFRKYEAALAVAQRARKKRRAAAIHAKIANARKHFLHEQSTRLVRTYNHIVVGNVNAAKLKRTKMAKSVSDVSWSIFRNMLAYKAIRHRARFEKVNEAFTSMTCSACGVRSGPQGRKGLEIREWMCSGCGSIHDRDTNAAINILLGAKCRPPVVGIAA